MKSKFQKRRSRKCLKKKGGLRPSAEVEIDITNNDNEQRMLQNEINTLEQQHIIPLKTKMQRLKKERTFLGYELKPNEQMTVKIINRDGTPIEYNFNMHSKIVDLEAGGSFIFFKSKYVSEGRDINYKINNKEITLFDLLKSGVPMGNVRGFKYLTDEDKNTFLQTLQEPPL